MTTIVFKDGFFAYDTLVTSGNHVEGYVDKVEKIGSLYVGTAGDLQSCFEFKRFIKGEEYDLDRLVDSDYYFEAITVNEETRDVKIYNGSNKYMQFMNDFYTIGSGSQVAKGALMMGASAIEAVRIASLLDINTNDRIKQVKVW